MERTIKQVIYGSVYLLFFVGCFFVVYQLALRPAPSCFDGVLNQNEIEVDCGGVCPSCALNALRDIEVRPQMLPNPLDAEKTMVYTELRNPNAAYGAASLTYRVSLVTGTSTELYAYDVTDVVVYPSEITYRVMLDVPVAYQRVSGATARVTDVTWESLESLTAPSLQVRELQAVLEEEKERLIISGIMKNENAYPLRSATIHTLITDTSGDVVGISRRSVQDVTPFEDRFFEVFVPISDVGASFARPALYIEVER